MKRVCRTCEYFSPAHTCIERPTWGYCMRLTVEEHSCGGQKGTALFTWADGICRDFKARQSVAARPNL